MISLSTNYKDKKNRLEDGGAWLLFLEMTISSLMQLNCSFTAVYLPGDTITGATSGATARIFSFTDLGGGSGQFILCNIMGIFQSGETLTPSSGHGSGTASGTASSASSVVFRFVRNTEDVSWDGEDWTAFPIEMEGIRKTSEGKFDDITVRFGNVDGSLNFYVGMLNGMEDEEVSMYVVHSDLLSEDAAMEEGFEIVGCTVTNTWIELSLAARNVFGDIFPLFKFNRNYCRWKFKDSTTCGYSSSDTSCDRRLITCRDKDNIARIGTFPSIPGGFYEVE